MRDPFDLARWYQPLRVVDVVDALDGLGYFDLGLLDSEIRPLDETIRFWGVAFTIRCVPANRPMWPLATTDDIVRAHGLWFAEVGHVGPGDRLRPGHVIVTDTGGCREVGYWGSANSLAAQAAGVVGIVTDGYARDTAELRLQGTPLCCRRRGRTIIPGRIMTVEVETTIACGGAQVNPGDIVGGDADGLVVVPRAVAEAVIDPARAILLADMAARRKLYDRLGRAPDATVDVAAVERYYAELAASA